MKKQGSLEKTRPYLERMTRAGQRAEAQVERGGGGTNHMRNYVRWYTQVWVSSLSSGAPRPWVERKWVASCVVRGPDRSPPPPVRLYLIPIPTTMCSPQVQYCTVSSLWRRSRIGSSSYATPHANVSAECQSAACRPAYLLASPTVSIHWQQLRAITFIGGLQPANIVICEHTFIDRVRS
jgi:hypothetical protein